MRLNSADGDPDSFSFSHPQGDPATDLAVSYRWSADLKTFHRGGEAHGGTTVTFATQTGTPEAGFATVTTSVSGTAVDRLFITVAVEGN